MIAGIYNITCEQGTDFSRSCILKYPDPTDPTGSTYLLYDLTGYTARMQIRQTLESATPEIELTTANGGIVLGGTAGTFEIVMTNTQTAALDSDGVYDLEIVSSGGTVSRVIQGTFTLDLEVTH